MSHRCGIRQWRELGNPPEKYERVFAKANPIVKAVAATREEEGPPEYIWGHQGY